jgi:hypothetical protein
MMRPNDHIILSKYDNKALFLQNSCFFLFGLIIMSIFEADFII